MSWKFWQKEQRSLEQEITPSVAGIGFSLFKGYSQPALSLSAVFAAVEIISNSVAELPITIKTKEENKVSLVKNHILYNVFKDGQLTKYMLMKSLISDMLLYGNGFAYIKRAQDGTPIELIYLPSNEVTIFYNNVTRQLYYLAPNVQQGNIEPSNMIHILKNSINGVEGIGVLKYAYNTISLSNYTEKAALDYFSSGCHVNGILKTTDPKSRLRQEQREQIYDAWQQGHGKNGTGMAILEGGLDYQAVSSNSKDAQLLETRVFNLQEVARFFNINPVLLGDLTHSSYSTIEASLLEFVTHTLFPYIILIEDEFTRKLIKKSEHNLYIDLDESFLLKSDKQNEAAYLSTLTKAGIMTTNEARLQLGLNPIDGGDTLMIPFTDVNQNTIGKQNDNSNNIDRTDDNNT